MSAPKFVADNIFEHPRLVAIYDALDPDRTDLEVYAELADELGAGKVLDVGCGTGTFALLLADRGLEVTGWTRLRARSPSRAPSLAPTVCAGSSLRRQPYLRCRSTWQR